MAVREVKPIGDPDIDLGDYQINFGKWKNQKLKEVDIYELANYVTYIENNNREQNKTPSGNTAAFLIAATKFLESRKPESPAALDVNEELPF